MCVHHIFLGCVANNEYCIPYTVRLENSSHLVDRIRLGAMYEYVAKVYYNVVHTYLLHLCMHIQINK
jgi:hypothetical protein